MKGYKKTRRDNDDPDAPKKEVVAASTIAVTMPSEIKPEGVANENKIDNSPLDKFKLHRYLQESLVRNEINKLTDIQSKCYQAIFNTQDVIAKATTGSGKTLAYLIPLINNYLEKKVITSRDAGTVLLVICPTRELCIQGEK